MDFKKWIKTEEGKTCNDFSTLKGQPYLKNRLWFAFTAGCESANSKLTELHKENESINYELGELLAILHGDGGHYQEKHGTLKAIIDAKELSNKEWIIPMEDKNLKRPYIRDWLNSYAIKNGYESIGDAIENSISIEDDIAMLIETFNKTSKQ